jgi:hypothetical protein
MNCIELDEWNKKHNFQFITSYNFMCFYIILNVVSGFSILTLPFISTSSSSSVIKLAVERKNHALNDYQQKHKLVHFSHLSINKLFLIRFLYLSFSSSSSPISSFYFLLALNYSRYIHEAAFYIIFAQWKVKVDRNLID